MTMNTWLYESIWDIHGGLKTSSESLHTSIYLYLIQLAASLTHSQLYELDGDLLKFLFNLFLPKWCYNKRQKGNKWISK